MAEDHVIGKLDFGVDELGLQEVKNIVEPVRAVCVAPSRRSPTNLRAVLRFDNMSCESEQRYFFDGIGENIITALGRFDWAFVIARN